MKSNAVSAEEVDDAVGGRADFQATDTSPDSVAQPNPPLAKPAQPPTSSPVGHSHLPAGYALVKELGVGGVATVYHCNHPQEGDVAVKVLSNDYLPDSTVTERFRREINAYLEINHPNVVGGRRLIEDRERAIIALVMDLAVGQDLSVRLQSKSFFPLFETIGLLVQLCEGLGAIHDKGIIHRDLKPENILVSPCGLLQITDFGVALMPGTSRLTEHGGVVGTLQYVSPEYLLSSQLDARSDIYAVGLIAYELLTGEAPFAGGELFASVTQRVKSDPPSPRSINPLIPPWLDSIVMKALARAPQDRFQQVSALKEELAAGIRREGLPISFPDFKSQNRGDSSAGRSAVSDARKPEREPSREISRPANKIQSFHRIGESKGPEGSGNGDGTKSKPSHADTLSSGQERRIRKNSSARAVTAKKSKQLKEEQREPESKSTTPPSRVGGQGMKRAQFARHPAPANTRQGDTAWSGRHPLTSSDPRSAAGSPSAHGSRTQLSAAPNSITTTSPLELQASEGIELALAPSNSADQRTADQRTIDLKASSRRPLPKLPSSYGPSQKPNFQRLTPVHQLQSEASSTQSPPRKNPSAAPDIHTAPLVTADALVQFLGSAALGAGLGYGILSRIFGAW